MQVFYEDDEVESVSLRIDYTTDYEFTLRAIIEFCILQALVILDEELSVLSSNFEIIDNAIKRSRQFKKYLQLAQNKLDE